jgi:hypothetical protein
MQTIIMCRCKFNIRCIRAPLLRHAIAVPWRTNSIVKLFELGGHHVVARADAVLYRKSSERRIVDIVDRWSDRRDPFAGRLLVRIVVACYGQMTLRGMRPKPCCSAAWTAVAGVVSAPHFPHCTGFIRARVLFVVGSSG